MNEIKGQSDFNLDADKIEFVVLNSPDNKEFDVAMVLYTEAFPENERHPVNVVRERVEKGLNQIYVGRAGSEIIFMALLWPLKNTDFVLLDYMATTSKYRGKNVGSFFLERMHRILSVNKKYFIIEAEHPEYGENKNERQKRTAFYQKNGAKILKNVRYVLPPLQGSTPTEMILMILPDYRKGKIDASIVKNLIIQIYKELYNREGNDMYLSASLLNIKDHIDLI